MKSGSIGQMPMAHGSMGVRHDALPQLIAATANGEPGHAGTLARARAFAEPLLIGESLETGENTLVHVQKQARTATLGAHLGDDAGTQTENVRKMLLAFSRDLRVVMLRLASRLQTLRFMPPASCPLRPVWRANHCRCLRRWPTAWASGR